MFSTTNQSLLNAITKKNFRMVKSILERGVDPNSGTNLYVKPLYYALKYSSTEIIKLLLKKGANPNYTTDDKSCITMMYHALHHKKNDAETIRYLLDAGVSLSLGNGNTALILAAKLWVSTEILELILKETEDINFQNQDNETALMWAALRANDRPDSLSLLLNSSKANSKLVDKKKYSALAYYLVWKEKCTIDPVLSLLMAGAPIGDPELRLVKYCSPEIQECVRIAPILKLLPHGLWKHFLVEEMGSETSESYSSEQNVRSLWKLCTKVVLKHYKDYAYNDKSSTPSSNITNVEINNVATELANSQIA